MSARTVPTTEQALAGATVGHRMAGMEPSPEGVQIARRFADGALTRDEALTEIRAAADKRTSS